VAHQSWWGTGETELAIARQDAVRAYHHPKMLYVDNVLVYVSGMKIAGGEYLIVVSYNSQPEALLRYKERWQVETLFKALKTNGFQVEDTHLK
jgi:transposase